MLASSAYDLNTFVRFIRQYPVLVIFAVMTGIPPVAVFGKVIRDHFGELTDAQLALFGKATRVGAEELGYRHLGIVVKFMIPGCPFGSGSLYG
ncbi:hypothetical protein ACT4MK_22160 [Bradyrhizobium barranii]|uniref:hypothetical protein n=1 Tax=Bradyrhizobium barranii TaxID=2992140 RepID=UPI0040349142